MNQMAQIYQHDDSAEILSVPATRHKQNQNKKQLVTGLLFYVVIIYKPMENLAIHQKSLNIKQSL